MKKIHKTIIFTFILFFLQMSVLSAEQVVVKDGDSLEIDNRRIRLDGIDAPEYTQICTDADKNEYYCGKQALYYLQNLTEGKDINCKCLPETDRYRREICECFAENLSLNREMVSAGWAVTYRDNTYADEEREAQENHRGIWQGKHMHPALYRVLHRYNKNN